MCLAHLIFYCRKSYTISTANAYKRVQNLENDDTAVNNQLNMSRRTTNKWDKSQTTAQFCLGRSSSGSIPGILPNTVDKVKTQDGEQTQTLGIK